jgi:hypothetical protein
MMVKPIPIRRGQITMIRNLLKRASWVRHVATLAVLAAVAGCAAPPARLVGAPPILQLPKLGQTWQFRELDGFSDRELARVGFRVTRSDADGVELAVTVDGEPLSGLREGQVERYARPWDVLEDASYGRVRRYTPAMPLLRADAPLETRVDDRMRVERPPKPRAENWIALSRFRGWETVTVPAGTFRVARYERVISYYDDDPFRWRTERRETLWYAPEVQHWVRRELAGTWTRPPYQRGRRGEVLRDDWIVWELTAYTP